MPADKVVHLNLSVSANLNERLEQLAAAGCMTKGDVLRRAVALFSIAAEATIDGGRVGIVDRDGLLTEIVGIMKSTS